MWRERLSVVVEENMSQAEKKKKMERKVRVSEKTEENKGFFKWRDCCF